MARRKPAVPRLPARPDGGRPRRRANLRHQRDHPGGRGRTCRGGAFGTAGISAKTVAIPTLAGSLYGKTLDQQRAQVVLDRLKHVPAFSDVKSGGTQDAGRNGVTFSITFTYTPPQRAVAVIPGNLRSEKVRSGI